MDRLTSIGRDLGEIIVDSAKVLAPIALLYMALRGLPWIIGVMANG